MYVRLMATGKKDFSERKSSRIQIPQNLKVRWWNMLEKKGIPQQLAVVRLVEFVLKQDDPVQSMVLGTLDPTDDLIELALRRAKSKLRYKSSTDTPQGDSTPQNANR